MVNSLYNKITETYKEIPKAVVQVVFRGLLLWLGFMFLYYYVLLPHGKLVKLFTHTTSISIIQILNLFYERGFTLGSSPPYGDYIHLGNKNILFVMDGCNAFRLYVLYIGFLLCASGKMIRKLIYGIAGVLIIFVLNIVRCTLIALLVIKKPNYVHFAHHYLFTIIVYAAIFLLWLSFLKKDKEQTNLS